MYNPATFQMFRSLISFFGLVFFFVLFGCSDQKTAEHSQKENLCQHSEYLRIYKYPQGYKVEILDPDQQRKLQVFEIQKPYARIAVLSATHVGMLSALGQQEKICAISNAKYLLDPRVKQLLQLKRIADLQTELGFSAEKLLQRKAQVVVYSGFGNESQQLKRLPAHMLKIANFEWREKTPLARAEWLLLFGALCGQFDQAQLLFEEIQANYIRIQKDVQQNNHSNQLPVLLSGNLYGDQWIAPAGHGLFSHAYPGPRRSSWPHGACGLAVGLALAQGSVSRARQWLGESSANRPAFVRHRPLQGRHLSRRFRSENAPVGSC